MLKRGSKQRKGHREISWIGKNPLGKFGSATDYGEPILQRCVLSDERSHST